MPRGPLNVTMKVNGEPRAEGTSLTCAARVYRQRVPRHRHRARVARSLDYYDKAPFKFNGTIDRVHAVREIGPPLATATY